MTLALFIIIGGLGLFWACQEDEGLETTTNTELTAVAKNGTAPCKNEVISVMGTGPTTAAARKAWGVNARVRCYNLCRSKACPDDDKSCLLKGVKAIGREVIERIPNPEDPRREDWIKITIRIQCKCGCGKCAGQKLAGSSITSSGPTRNDAINNARRAALDECKTTVCPTIKGCPEGKRCVGTGSTVDLVSAEFDATSGRWFAEVLLTKCKCKCEKQ